MKLCLGTVQFGLDYGISNKTGKLSIKEIESILDFCSENNIDTIDTAQGYGNSEEILGNFDLSKINIITKTSDNGKLEDSLTKLKVPSVYGLLLHNENEIEANWKRFEDYKSCGLAKKIGVSVYSPEKLSFIINNYPIDIVQLPLNVLDQRFLPLLKDLKNKNIEVHTRSAFLQGLLLMNYSEIPDYFNSIKPVLEKIPENKLGFAVNFVKNINEINKIVIGITSKKDLEEICTEYNANNSFDYDYAEFSVNDEKMINPSLWNYK